MWRVQVMSVRRTWRKVNSVGSPGYKCEEDREDSEECGHYVSKLEDILIEKAVWSYTEATTAG